MRHPPTPLTTLLIRASDKLAETQQSLEKHGTPHTLLKGRALGKYYFYEGTITNGALWGSIITFGGTLRERWYNWGHYYYGTVGIVTVGTTMGSTISVGNNLVGTIILVHCRRALLLSGALFDGHNYFEGTVCGTNYFRGHYLWKGEGGDVVL